MKITAEKLKDIVEKDKLIMRSCWECNGCHEHLKKTEILACFECGKYYYFGTEISQKILKQYSKLP